MSAEPDSLAKAEPPSTVAWSASGRSWGRAWNAFVARNEWVLGWGLLAPAFLWSGVALALPLFALIAYSFWTQNGFELDRTISLRNYFAFFDRPIYTGLLIRSMRISLLTTVATIVLAYPVAYFIAFKVRSTRWLWLLLFSLPFWTSYLLKIFSWKIILGHGGVINSALVGLGILSEPTDVLLYNEPAVILTLTHAWLTFAILPIYLSLVKIDCSLIEAAADLGETPIMVFLRVTLPLSMPGVLVAGLLIFIPTVGDYVTPTMVGGPGGAMIGSVTASLIQKSNDAPMAAAVAIISILAIAAVLIAVWGLYRLARRSVA